VFNYGYPLSQSTGYFVSIQHALDFPQVRLQGFRASPGARTSVALTPVVTKHTEDAMKYDARKRNCFQEDDVSLSFVKSNKFRYSHENCAVEAAYIKIREECKCRRGITPMVYDKGYAWVANATFMELSLAIHQSGKVLEDLLQRVRRRIIISGRVLHGRIFLYQRVINT